MEDDRAVITDEGADLLHLADDRDPHASQWDEVAMARERRELRENRARADLALWNEGAVADPWEERIAQRHRFGRELDDTPKGPPKVVPWAAVIAAVIGVASMTLALYCAGNGGAP